MSFKLNYGYHLYLFFKEDINPCSRSKIVDKLLAELQELITICQKNLYHAQEFQKQAQNEGVKSKSYDSGDKVWPNSKYIKIKQKQELEIKFFKTFQVFYLVGKQA